MADQTIMTGAFVLVTVQMNTLLGTIVASNAFDTCRFIQCNHHVYTMAVNINGQQIAGRLGRVDEEGEITFPD